MLEVIQSRSLFRWYGPKPTKTVAALEHDLAAFVGAKYALAVTSGTAALQLPCKRWASGPETKLSCRHGDGTRAITPSC